MIKFSTAEGKPNDMILQGYYVDSDRLDLATVSST